MASTTLFAPSVRAVQPAFIYSSSNHTVRVYFTLNYNPITHVYGLRYSLIDPNKSSIDGGSSMIDDFYYKEEESAPRAGVIYYTYNSSDEVYTQFDGTSFTAGTDYFFKTNRYIKIDTPSTQTGGEYYFEIDLSNDYFKPLTVNQFY
jgi:hypothetical protein